MHELTKKCLLRSAILFGYGLLGAWIFYELEKKPITNEEASTRIINKVKHELENRYNIASNELDQFIANVSRATVLKRKTDWTYVRSFAFVIASLTTIGYGNVTPTSPFSQGIFILFCLIGLPINMLALKTAGEIIANGYKRLILYIEERVFNNHQIATRSLKIKTLIVSFFASGGAVVLMGIIQAYLEGWTIIEGIYAWGVTLSTIGFGDYIPFLSLEDDMRRKWGKHYSIMSSVLSALTLLPMLFLLSIISSTLSSIIDCIEILRPTFDLSRLCRERVAKNCIDDQSSNENKENKKCEYCRRNTQGQLNHENTDGIEMTSKL